MLFPTDKVKRKTLENYIPAGRTFRSSLKDFETKFRQSRQCNINVGIALGAALLTLVIGGTSLWWNQFEYFKTLRDTLDAQIIRNAILTESKDHAQQKIDQLESKVEKIESELANLKKKPKSDVKLGLPVRSN